LISDNKGHIKVINMSTGKSILRVKALANITCMHFDALGNFLYAGDEKGFVEVFKFTKDSALQVISKTSVSLGLPVTNLVFKGIFTNHQFSPTILVNSKDSTIKIYVMKNTPAPGTLVQVKDFHIDNKKDLVKSNWCPLVDSLCVVTGNENCSISFFDIRRKDKPINTLMGHGATVSDVSWSYDETMLASGDASGMVILWSRKTKHNS